MVMTDRTIPWLDFAIAATPSARNRSDRYCRLVEQVG
jgi:hypothetical protein